MFKFLIKKSRMLYSTYQAKLLLAFFLCTLIPLSVIGVASYCVSYSIARDKILDSVILGAGQLKARLDGRIRQAEHVADTIQYNMYTLNHTDVENASSYIEELTDLRNRISLYKDTFNFLHICIFFRDGAFASHEGFVFFPLSSVGQFGISTRDLDSLGTSSRWLYAPSITLPSSLNTGKAHMAAMACLRTIRNQNLNRLDYAYCILMDSMEFSDMLASSFSNTEIISCILTQDGTIAAGAMPVRAKPAEAESAETKPAGAKPAGSKSAGAKSAGSKPAGTKLAGTKPAGAKSAGAKPTGSKPAGSKPAGSKPAGAKPAGAKPTGTMSTVAKPTGAIPMPDTVASVTAASANAASGNAASANAASTTAESTTAASATAAFATAVSTAAGRKLGQAELDELLHHQGSCFEQDEFYCNVLPLDNGWMQIAYIPKSYIADGTKLLLKNMVLAILLFLPLTAGVILFLSRNLSIRLRLLSKSMEEFRVAPNHGMEDAPLCLPRPNNPDFYDEIDRLGLAFERMQEAIQKNMASILDLSLTEERLKYQLLQSQINPHFLYNILGTIKACQSFGNLSAAGEMITDLARFYRLTLHKSGELISIREEMEIASLYMRMEKHCHKHALDWEVKLEDGIDHFLICKFTLQPFLENSILHGISPRTPELFVRVSVSYGEDTVIIAIEDNGSGIPVDKLKEIRQSLLHKRSNYRKHFGICNVNARIASELYGKGRITIDSEPYRKTLVTIEFSQMEGEVE